MSTSGKKQAEKERDEKTIEDCDDMLKRKSTFHQMELVFQSAAD